MTTTELQEPEKKSRSGCLTCLVVALACAILGAGAIWGLWRMYGPALKEAADEIRVEAKAFAEGREQSACVPEALARARACDGLLCEMGTVAFTSACLKHTRPDPAACDGVPDSILDGALWTMSQCDDTDVTPDVCERIHRELLKVCHSD